MNGTKMKINPKRENLWEKRKSIIISHEIKSNYNKLNNFFTFHRNLYVAYIVSQRAS